jgi:hypothetical protein
MGAVLGSVAGFLQELFGGGGGGAPIPRQLLHGRHPLYAGTIGIRTGLITNERSVAPAALQSGASAPAVENSAASPSHPRAGLRYVQEVIPVEPRPLIEEGGGEEILPPQSSPTGRFPMPSYSSCLDAAQDPHLWQNFCGSLPTPRQRAICRTYQFSSVQERQNACAYIYGFEI